MTVSLSSRLHHERHDDYDLARAEIWRALGDIRELRICGSQILVACYARPISRTVINQMTGEKVQLHTRGEATGSELDRSEVYQGKTGMIVALGDAAWKIPGKDELLDPNFFGGRYPEVGDWVVTFPQNAAQISVMGLYAEEVAEREWKYGWPCRLVFARDINMVIPEPHMVV